MSIKSPEELRAFVLGTVAGIAILIGSFIFVSEVGGIKWQPVHQQDRQP